MNRLVESGRGTAGGEIQFVFYVDDDDDVSLDVAYQLRADAVTGPRIVLSQMWNKCYEEATYDIVMHGGDDIVFRTPGWDQRVIEAFENVPDRIALVHGRDGVHDQNLATHGFLHRRWVDVLGYVVPPYFSSDYNDLWLTEVADKIDRRIYLPGVYTEHMHPAVGKAEIDRTHQERLERHAHDGVDQLYRNLAPQREADALKLQTYIQRKAEA